MSYKIERATEENITDMLKCYNSANHLFPKEIRTDGTIEIFKDVFDNNKVNVLIENDKVAGWISYSVNKGNALISGMYVYEEYQKKGYGCALLTHCIENLKMQSVETACLSALKMSPWAVKFYCKNGFKIYEGETLDTYIELNEYLQGYKEKAYAYALYRVI